MPARDITKTTQEAYLETLKGLRTLVEMQQMLIAEAIGRFDKPIGAVKITKPRSSSRKKTAKA